MSVNENGQYENKIEVSDDEEYTDKKIKQRLLNTRELLVTTKNRLETERLVEPDVQYSEFEAFAAWAGMVQSYLHELGILLNHDDIPQADYYANQIDLGKVWIVPEDTAGIPFSNIQYDDVDPEDIVYESAELQRGADVPEPEKVPFQGLNAVAKTEIVLERRWTVLKNPMEAKPNQERITVVGREPVPKHLFQEALVQSDQFLQNCGIGLDISASDYMAEGEPGL